MNKINVLLLPIIIFWVHIAHSSEKNTSRETQKHLFLVTGASTTKKIKLSKVFLPMLEKEFGKENILCVSACAVSTDLTNLNQKYKMPPDYKSNNPSTQGMIDYYRKKVSFNF